MMNNLFKGLIIFSLASLTACSNFQGQRHPSSAESLKDILQDIHGELASPPVTHKACFERAQVQYQRLFGLNLQASQMQELSSGDVEDLLAMTFESKLKIRKYIGQLDLTREYSEQCYRSTRALLRAIRYAEDYLLEKVSLDNKPQRPQEYVTLTGEGVHFKVNPAFTFKHYNDLQSGDVILSRGNAYTSAAIARIGEDDAQFSHVSFVYRDPEGKLWTTEAHIEIGSVVAPIETHIAQANARTVVFRFDDQAMSHKAAEYIYKLAKAASAKGRNIPYDFGMNYKDSKELFCSEVVSKAMRDVGSVDIPKFKTHFNKNLVPFLQQFGIKVDDKTVLTFDTFSPGDLEVDPRFTVVAEWRNPDKMGMSRQRDAILTKMFEWMEKEHYRFRPGVGISIKSNMGWLMRRLPLVKRKLEHQFPLNMGAGQLKLFMVLEKVAEVLENELLKFDSDKAQPKSIAELYQHLEKFKQDDFTKFQKKKSSSAFHKHFAP